MLYFYLIRVGESSVPDDTESFLDHVQSLCTRENNQHLFPIAYANFSSRAFLSELANFGQGAVEFASVNSELPARILRQLERAQRYSIANNC
jgi:hypothetical protein